MKLWPLNYSFIGRLMIYHWLHLKIYISKSNQINLDSGWKTDKIDKEDFPNYELENEQEPTVHQPVSYIPQKNFWFKMLNLKIKKKYQIDIQQENNFQQKFLVVFIKDASIEHFSIYSLKL